ncbi:MAG: DNA alkylation repair protein [Rhodothermales bacterium]|nr:DNA alkylation repair protein [Rhodothermales bacterium]MBO6778607.1 DNA alkylation repair protein [Rhodothermales bacterium]
MSAQEIISHLESLSDEKNVAGMARFGIQGGRVLGISMPVLHALAKEHRKQHTLALALWDSGIHEARILAVLVADPAQVTRDQAERWAHDLESWDVCDQLCMRLLHRVPFAWDLAQDWCRREHEFVKRAGFVLPAVMSFKNKKVPDQRFLEFFPELLRGASDPRNYVKKAVSWAIREIGKRRPGLHPEALNLCDEILALDTPPARWIARDALRELTSEKVLARVRS